MKTIHIHVNSVADAWKAADAIIPTDYMKDDQSTARAGYDVYRSTAAGHEYTYICDLETRLEINLDDGSTVNIWIDGSTEKAPEPAPINAERVTLDVSRLDCCRVIQAVHGVIWDMRDEMRDDATTDGRRAVLRESIKMWERIGNDLSGQLDRHDAKNGVGRL